MLVFAPAADDPSLARQRELLSGEERGVSGRDLRIEYLTGEAAAEARRRYGAKEEFEALLVGRDGGVKLRSPEPVGVDELFGRIDKMPMRRREIREMQQREQGGGA